METKQRIEETLYAKNIKGEEYHISQVERGRKGYYCIDCDQEMVACKGDIVSPYFRHHVTDVTIERKCTFSNETYRHRVAKEILQRIRQIRVPAVDKYAPKGSEGVMRLKGAETIHAYSVGIEYRFYEDETSQIKWMSNPEWVEGDPQKRLIVQPDVTFFDQHGNPILFIEIVATHKPDDDKLSKLKRLGINTIAVTIPKESAEAIERIFYHTDNTYWLYNHEEEEARYVPVFRRNSEEVLPVNQLQRRLLEESVNCRSTEIGNLIRAIERCLESEQYGAIKQELTTEISRVTDNAARDQQRLLRLQTSHKKRIEIPFRGRTLQIAKAARKLGAKRKDLESRYYRKRSQLESAEAEYRPERQDEIDRIAADLIELGAGDGSIQDRQEQLTTEEATVDQRIGETRRATAAIQRRVAALPNQFRASEDQLVKAYRQQRKAVGTNFKQQAAAIEAGTERDREELRSRHDQYRKQAADAVAERDSRRSTRLSSRIADLVKAGRLVVDTTPKYDTYRRLREAQKIFNSGSYKNWV